MNPTDISKEVYEISKELFDELWDGATPRRLLGIITALCLFAFLRSDGPFLLGAVIQILTLIDGIEE